MTTELVLQRVTTKAQRPDEPTVIAVLSCLCVFVVFPQPFRLSPCRRQFAAIELQRLAVLGQFGVAEHVFVASDFFFATLDQVADLVTSWSY